MCTISFGRGPCSLILKVKKKKPSILTEVVVMVMVYPWWASYIFNQEKQRCYWFSRVSGVGTGYGDSTICLQDHSTITIHMWDILPHPEESLGLFPWYYISFVSHGKPRFWTWPLPTNWPKRSKTNERTGAELAKPNEPTRNPQKKRKTTKTAHDWYFSLFRHFPSKLSDTPGATSSWNSCSEDASLKKLSTSLLI